MITEGLIIASIAGLLYRRDNLEKITQKKELKKQEKEFVNKWKLTMKYNGIKNKNEQTFEVLKYIPKKYGCDAIISIPLGLDYDGLMSKKSIIESAFGGIIDMEWKQFKNCIYLKFAQNQIDDNYKFQPIETKPWQLVLGITPFEEMVIADMSKSPHALFSGSNNSGKTYCLITALTNLINQHHERELELYLTQISSKKDLRKFAEVKQCKYYADTPQKALLMYKYLFSLMERRNKIFHDVKDGYVDTIYEYNKRFPKRKLSFVYCACDEFSFFIPSTIDDEDTADWKKQCLDIILTLIKEGRNCGIYLLLSLQRPDRSSMLPEIKSQCNTKVVFKQVNSASSLVVLDDTEAIKLKQREAIVWMDDKQYMKTMYLDNNMVEEYISNKVEKDHKHLNLDGYSKKIEQNEEKNIKKVEKSAKNTKNNTKNQENIKKVSNRIPIGSVKK